MKRLILFISCFLFPVSCFLSCVDADDFTIRSIDITQVRLPSAATLEIGLESRSPRRLQLLECALDVELAGRRTLAVVLTEQVSVPPRYVGEVNVPLRMRIVDPFAALGALDDLDHIWKQATVSGEATIRVGGIRRKIRLRHYPLSKFIDTFAS